MVLQVNTFSYIWLASEALSYLHQAQGERASHSLHYNSIST